MSRKTAILFGAAAALAGLWLGPAQAKDLFYYLGQGSVQVIDGDTDAIVADIPVKGWSRSGALSSDKRTLYVMANRHLIHKIDTASNKLAGTADVNQDGWDHFIFGFCMANDDKTGYAAMMSRKTDGGEVVIGTPVVAQVDLDTGKILRSVEVPWGVASLARVKDGTWVYAIGKDLYKIDATGSDMKVAETVPYFEKKYNMLPFWDYQWENGGVWIANYYTPELMGLLTIDAAGTVGDIPIKGDPAFAYSVIFSPDKKAVYGTMDDLTTIDVAKKKYAASVPHPEGTSYGINVTSDGKKIYVGGGGSTLMVYDAKTLKVLKTLQMASDGMDIRRVTF
jgi:DNA-binding beta-propeller fold protein YncE